MHFIALGVEPVSFPFGAIDYKNLLLAPIKELNATVQRKRTNSYETIVISSFFKPMT